jgi:hypothetical protein
LLSCVHHLCVSNNRSSTTANSSTQQQQVATVEGPMVATITDVRSSSLGAKIHITVKFAVFVFVFVFVFPLV